jgi:glycosyltransferase involved in cell wall biosynthesis
MPKRKKILFVEQNQDGTVGGSYYCLLYFLKCLDRKKYDPIVMFYDKNLLIDKFKREQCSILIFIKPTGRKFSSPYPLLNIFYLLLQKIFNFINVSFIPLIKFIFVLLKNRIFLIQLNNTARIGWEWLFAAKLLKIKCITYERSLVKYDRIAKGWANRFDKIVCVSNAVKESLNKFGVKANTLTIYDSMDPNEFKGRIEKSVNEVKIEFGVKHLEPLIGVVGNFQEWKGQLTVIKATEYLKGSYPNIVCLLIGDVSLNNFRDKNYFAKVQEEITLRHLEKNVIITGYRSDVPDLMNALDILIHSSIEPEPFGMVVLEGMCLEKPVVATDIGGPLEIIEDGYSGILVPPNDPSILAQKLEYLLSNQDARREIGINGYNRVKQDFSLNTFSENISKLYENIFSRNSSS